MEQHLSQKQIYQLLDGARQQAKHDIRDNGSMDDNSYDYLKYMGERYGLGTQLMEEYSKEFDRIHRGRGYRNNGGRLR